MSFEENTLIRRRPSGYYSSPRLVLVAVMQVKHTTTAKGRHAVKHLPVDLSRDAQRRLKWIDYYRSHGENASLTCRHFDISRTTFYCWFGRYDAHNLRTLEARPSTPNRRCSPTWSLELQAAVLELRQKYGWGKDKLAVLLRKTRIVSVSMVGRILDRLLQTKELVEAPRFAISVRKRRLKRVYAIRKPKDYEAKEPGDIVQVDTLDVRPLPGVVRKQFTANDVISRYDVLDIRGCATAKMAAEFLNTLIQRMPFPIRAIQIDNGSEFKAEFEEACQTMKVKLFVLPPRSPKLNGHVERAQRTHTEEHWELSSCDTDLESMRSDLRQWEHVYNTIRPHQSLGYLTPKEYVENWKLKQPLNQVV